MGDRSLNYIEVREWCLALEVSWVDFTREVDALLQVEDQEERQLKDQQLEERPLPR